MTITEYLIAIRLWISNPAQITPSLWTLYPIQQNIFSVENLFWPIIQFILFILPQTHPNSHTHAPTHTHTQTHTRISTKTQFIYTHTNTPIHISNTHTHTHMTTSIHIHTYHTNAHTHALNTHKRVCGHVSQKFVYIGGKAFIHSFVCDWSRFHFQNFPTLSLIGFFWETCRLWDPMCSCVCVRVRVCVCMCVCVCRAQEKLERERERERGGSVISSNYAV